LRERHERRRGSPSRENDYNPPSNRDDVSTRNHYTSQNPTASRYVDSDDDDEESEPEFDQDEVSPEQCGQTILRWQSSNQESEQTSDGWDSESSISSMSSDESDSDEAYTMKGNRLHLPMTTMDTNEALDAQRRFSLSNLHRDAAQFAAQATDSQGTKTEVHPWPATASGPEVHALAESDEESIITELDDEEDGLYAWI